MGFGIKELIVILIIVLILFGTKRLKTLGTDLGSAIKGFRKSVNEEEDIKKESDAIEQKSSSSPTDQETKQ